MTSYHFRWGKPRTSGPNGMVGSWNRKSRDLRWETADECEKGIAGSWNRKSRDLRWETADECEKGIAGSWNRKSRDLRWETADECEKRIVGSRWVKTAEKTRAQSPKSNLGKEGWSLQTTRNKKIIFFIKLVFTRTEKCFWSVP